MKALSNGMLWSEVPGIIDYMAKPTLRPSALDSRPLALEPQCPIYRTPNACEFEGYDGSLRYPPPAHRIPFEFDKEDN